ncbi:MAG TPA: hypothetical protein VM509_06415, partial [Planctomycetota bacterium]|nr:hypothetical protein [Planctomycetota bacterium]
ALSLWGEEKASGTLIAQMTLHAQLEEALAKLEEDVRRTVDEKQILFVQSERRLHNEVVTPLNSLRTAMSENQVNEGPSKESLRELVSSMQVNLQNGEYKVAQIAFDTVESRLSLAEADPLRQPLVAELRRLDAEAKDLGDFVKIKLDIGGVAVGEGMVPAVIINNNTLGEGDLLEKELVIHSIKPGVIEFLFRGMILERRF